MEDTTSLKRLVPLGEALAKRLVDNPDLARWGTELQQRQAAIELAEVQKTPDLTASGGVRHVNEAGATAFVFALSVPLPVANRNQGAILEAQYRRTKAEEERHAALVRAHVALGATYATLTTAFTEVTTLQREVLPGAHQIFEATSSGYQQGKLSLADVLDAQRLLFEARGQYIEALAPYHKAIAEAERLIGGELAAVTGTARPPRQGAP